MSPPNFTFALASDVHHYNWPWKSLVDKYEVEYGQKLNPVTEPTYYTQSTSNLIEPAAQTQ